MVQGLKFAAVSAIFLFPFVGAHSAHARPYLSYQEAVWMCGAGNLQACEAMYAYEMARSGASGGTSTVPQDHTTSASRRNGDSGTAAPTSK